MRYSGQLAELEHLLGGCRREQMHHPGNQPCPSGLMAGSEAGSVVAIEVLVEQKEIPPVRVFLEFLRSSIHGTSAVGIPQKDASQPTRDLLGDLVEGHGSARP